MPDSPIVRKYLEMSDDAHMFEAIAGRHTLGEACAAAFAGSASARALAPCCDELRLAGPPAGRSSAASPAAAEEESRISSEFVAQVQASKGILVQQLIEMSDQVAQVHDILHACLQPTPKNAPSCYWCFAFPTFRLARNPKQLGIDSSRCSW